MAKSSEEFKEEIIVTKRRNFRILAKNG